LYAILSRPNSVAVFAINNSGKAGSNYKSLIFTGLTYSLIPPGASKDSFTGEDVFLSLDSNVLFASARGASTATKSGYITAILLTPLSERENPINSRQVGSGFPLRPMFQLATTTNGGRSIAISPAPWSSDYFALTDSVYGLIEIYKINDLASVDYNGAVAEGALTPPRGGWIKDEWSPQGFTVQPVVGDNPSKGSQPGQPSQPYSSSRPQTQPITPISNNPRPTYQAGVVPLPPRPVQPFPNGGWPILQPFPNYGWPAQPPQPFPLNAPWSDSGRGRGWRRWLVQAHDPGNVQLATVKPAHGWLMDFQGRLDVQSLNQKKGEAYQADIRRQMPVMTAKIVASWRAPVGGGTLGRRPSSMMQRFVSESDMQGRSANSTRQESQSTKSASFIQAQAEGKACCTNVVWWD